MIERYETGARMSQAVRAGGLVFLSGQVAADPTPSAREQTRAVLQSIDRLLAAAGSDRARLVSATIWLASMEHFEEMNLEWDAWVTPAATPARATVQAQLAKPEYLVEIAVVAASTS